MVKVLGEINAGWKGMNFLSYFEYYLLEISPSVGRVPDEESARGG
jgi:hypothetical protein